MKVILASNSPRRKELMKENIPVIKNEEYIVDIIDNGYEGEGIAKINGYTIFIQGAIKGERCKILIVKITTSHGYGKLIEIIKQSQNRKESDCSTYARCGGCSLRHIDYQATLKLKQEMVQNLVNKSLEEKIEVKPTIGMEKPYNYRNKAQYPLGYNKHGEVITGIFAERTHEVIPMLDCKIQHPISEQIAKIIVNFIKENNLSVYNEENGKGIFRHIVVKVGIKTKEVMCVLVVNQKELNFSKLLVEYLLQKFNYEEYQIKTIVQNINMKSTNVILGNENITLYGDGYIYGKLGEYIFKISPMSFYQTNPIQTEVLYNKAIEVANLQKDDILLDLYCGIGTIGIYASKFVNKVYGVEIVEQAIEDAKENAKINNVNNINFTCGDVEYTLPEILKRSGAPNVIFVDPPRRGLDNVTIENILKVSPNRLIYISCNPATMIRDIKLLSKKYEIKEIQPVDMFPFTTHVECVASLNLKNS